MKTYKQNNNKTIILLLILFAIGLGIGYAVLTEKLTIDSSVEYNSMKWNVGFVSATDGGGSITTTPSISQDKKTITITCNLGTSTKSETCIAKASIKNDSTFNVVLSSNPTISFDETYIKSVETIWSSDLSVIAANNQIDAGATKEVQITIMTNALTEETLPTTPTDIEVKITMDFVEVGGQVTETVEPITSNFDFGWTAGTINSAGETQANGKTLNNYYTPITYFTKLDLTLLEDNIMFKIVEYDEEGTFIQSGSWQSKSATTWSPGGIETITIENKYVRIAIADTTLNESDDYTLTAADYSTRYSYVITTPIKKIGQTLTAMNTIQLPNIKYGEAGKGFTITGLTYSAIDNTYYAGNYGKVYTSDTVVNNTIVHLSSDLTTNLGEIELKNIYSDVTEVQGVTVDTSDDSLWFVSPGNAKAYHITKDGTGLGTISLSAPYASGIAYDSRTDTLWILDRTELMNIKKDGTKLSSIPLNINQVDQLYLDETNNDIYITAGADYNGENYVYKVNLDTNKYVLYYTLSDSYSIEGIVIKDNKMYIGNDGVYHEAAIEKNIIQVYDLTK